MKKKWTGISGKVRELRVLLGGRSAVVDAMKSASKTSLGRWESRQCSPLRAHVRIVNETYEIAQRMETMLKKRQKSKKRKQR